MKFLLLFMKMGIATTIPKKPKGFFMENKNITASLLKAQGNFTNIKKNGVNSFYKSSRYALLDDIYEACVPALAGEGIKIFHKIIHMESHFWVRTTLHHTSGEIIESDFPMFIESQTNHSIGSARTYACRYSLCNILAIPMGIDDDGNEAEEKSKVVTEKKRKVKSKDSVKESVESYKWEGLTKFQEEALEGLLEEDERTKNFILDSYREAYPDFSYESLRDLPSKHFDSILDKARTLISAKKPVRRQR